MITAEQSGAEILRAAALSKDWKLGSSSGFNYCFSSVDPYEHGNSI